MLPPNAADSSTNAVPELQCKGSHARQIRNWVDQRRGPGTFQQLISRRSGENLAWQHLLVGGWYDAEALLDGYVELRTHGIPPRFVPWVVGGWRGFLAETLLAAGGKRPVVSGIRIASKGSLWSVRVEATYE